MRLDLTCSSFVLAAFSLSWKNLYQLLLAPPYHIFDHDKITGLFCSNGTAVCQEYNDFAQPDHPSHPTFSHAAICTSIHSQLQQAASNDVNKHTEYFTVVSEDSHQYSKQSILYWSEVCGLSNILNTIHVTPAPYAHAHAIGNVEEPQCEGSNEHRDDADFAEIACNHVCNVRTVNLAGSLASSDAVQRLYNSSSTLDMYCIEDFFGAVKQQHSSIHWVYVPSLLFRHNHTSNAFVMHNMVSIYYELLHVLYAARNLNVALSIDFMLVASAGDESPKEILQKGQLTDELSHMFPYTAPANLHRFRTDLLFPSRSWMFIYIVVYDFHEPLARDFVELMRLQCLQSECEAYVNFIIVTVDSGNDAEAMDTLHRYQIYQSMCMHRTEHVMLPSELCELGARIVADYLSCTPGPISSLLELSAHMKDSNTADDTVYFLPGLQSLYSFPHPVLNIYTLRSRCYASNLEEFHAPQGPYSLPYYVWPDGACKYAKLLQVWNVSGELAIYSNLPSAVVLSQSSAGDGSDDGIGKAYMGQAESVLAYTELLLRCASANLQHNVLSASSDGHEREWVVYSQCSNLLHTKLQQEATKPAYLSVDTRHIFVPQEAAALLLIVAEQLSSGNGSWVVEDQQLATSQFILHFFANQLMGVLTGQLHPNHEKFTKPRRRPSEVLSKQTRLLALLQQSRWLHQFDVQLEYVNITIVDYFEEWFGGKQESENSKSICVLEIDEFLEVTRYIRNSYLTVRMYERYTGVLSYAFMQDYIITHCKSNHMASLLTKEISYYLSEAVRDVPFYLPSFGEAEAILNLLEHLQSTMLLEISISNLHYSVNVLASLIARLVNDHYTARRKFAYSVWRAHQSTMQIVELQKRRARIEQSYAFSPDKVRVHYVTYGSNMRNDGLQWLLKSASLAGVRLQVLGQGEIYIGLGSKVSAYHSYIMSPALLEEDVAVLVDGYDVLFFPSVRRLLSIMRRITDKPIVICAEGGIYPELMSPYFYHHQPSSGSARSKLSPHFVNSGVVIGKVWALRQFYKWAIQLFDTANCDQYLLNRHVLMVPDLYHIDYDQALSSAGYKNHVLLNALDSNDLYISNDLALKVRLVSANKNTSISSSRDVLIFHANVKHSNKLYDGITRVYGESLKVNFMAEGKIDASKIRSLWEIVDRGV